MITKYFWKLDLVDLVSMDALCTVVCVILAIDFVDLVYMAMHVLLSVSYRLKVGEDPASSISL